MPEVPNTKEKESKFTLFTVVLLTIGNALGSGIFVLLAKGANIAGTLLPLSFLAGGVIAFLIGIVYAEVVASAPESEESLTYRFSAYGRNVIPFILTWLSTLASLAYGAINALGFALYLSLFVNIAPLFLALGGVLVFFLLNLLDIKNIGKIGAFVAILLLFILGVVAALASGEISYSFEQVGSLFNLSFPAMFGIISGTALIFSSFVGFEGISSIAENVKDPAKNLPRAIFITIGVMTLIYTSISFLVVYALPLPVITASETPLIVLAHLSSKFATTVVIWGALIATASSVLMAIFISSRQITAVAKQGFLPEIFFQKNKKGLPVYSIILSALAIGAFVFTQSVPFMAYLGNSSYFLLAATSATAVIIMREKRPYLERHFQVPFFPVLPIITIILALILLVFTGAQSIFWLVVWSFAGFAVYLASFFKRQRLIWLFFGIFVFFMISFFILLPILTSV